MNYRRLAAAAVAAWLFDSIFGFLVFGVALNGEFARYPGVFRSYAEVNAMLPLMFGSSLAGSFCVAYIFAMGRGNRPGWEEGLRFGIVLALFELFAIQVPSYVIYNYGRLLAVETAVGSFVDAVAIGVILGIVYASVPAAAPRQIAGV